MLYKLNDSARNETMHPSFKRRILVYLLNLILIASVCIAGYVAVIYLRMPSLDAILNETRSAAVVFMDKNGNEIRSSGRIMGTPVSVDNLPPYVWQSIVAIEDKRFFEHGPVDGRGIMRAVVINMFSGHFAVGGSSITQQTAKNKIVSRARCSSRPKAIRARAIPAAQRTGGADRNSHPGTYTAAAYNPPAAPANR